MTLRGPILAATNLSDESDEAVRQGHVIATAIGAPFIVTHVLPEAFKVRVLFPQDAGVDSAEQAGISDRARTVVRSWVDRVLGPQVEPPAIEFESGSAHAGILEVAERVGAGLIAVGPGPTALRVARHALCPVLIARPSPTDGDVLAATDFSDPALPAVHMAADEAVRRKTGLRLLHSLDLDEAAALAAAAVAGVVVAPVLPQQVVEQLESAARGRLVDALAGTDAKGEAIVIRQRPGAGIVDSARVPPASLVVVGTRGRTGLPRIVLGSTAEHVVTHAPCSVIVVPLSAAARTAGPANVRAILNSTHPRGPGRVISIGPPHQEH